MTTVDNMGNGPMEYFNETSAARIGARIRDIRNIKGLSQAELGEMVGLNADRIQKYENGARKPKDDMLKNIANALNVSILALTDPVNSFYLGAMFSLFELEKTYKMKIDRVKTDDGFQMCLSTQVKDHLYLYMERWYDIYEQTLIELENVDSTKEHDEIMKSYHEWEWNFPAGIVDETVKESYKHRLKQQICDLQEIYDRLYKDDDE